MTINEILDQWNKDGQLAPLGGMCEQKHTLHVKYYPIYLREKIQLRKMKSALKNLRTELKHFFLYSDDWENEKGWKLPDSGKILRTEVNEHIDMHREVVKAELDIAGQEEKVELLSYIIKEISGRNFLIKARIEEIKLKEGLI